jgi:hypothetical protein
MTRQRTVLLAASLLALSVAVAASPAARPEVQRGAYLVKIMGCNDCHTPLPPS